MEMSGEGCTSTGVAKNSCAWTRSWLVIVIVVLEFRSSFYNIQFIFFIVLSQNLEAHLVFAAMMVSSAVVKRVTHWSMWRILSRPKRLCRK